MTNQLPKFFRIAVYGMLIQNEQLLLCKENIQNKEVIKFPGGGLNFGEGTKDALIREFKEELEIDIHNIQHIYTTDFFIQSAFHKDYQVIAIYYLVNTHFILPYKPFIKNNIKFFWVSTNNLTENLLTFDSDKKAIQEFIKKLSL